MSFLKALFLAVLATLFLTYVLGVSFNELLDVHIDMDGQLIEPIKAISFSALMVVLLAFVVLAIVISVFGSVIFVALLLLGGGAMLAVGVFWPIFLVAGIIWLVTRDKRSAQY